MNCYIVSKLTYACNLGLIPEVLLAKFNNVVKNFVFGNTITKHRCIREQLHSKENGGLKLMDVVN